MNKQKPLDMKKTPTNLIDITGANLTDVAKIVYGLSKPLGLGELHHEAGELADWEAESLIDESSETPLVMDYVKGRACKMTVIRNELGLFIKPYWYDHTDEQFQELLRRIDEMRIVNAH